MEALNPPYCFALFRGKNQGYTLPSITFDWPYLFEPQAFRYRAAQMPAVASGTVNQPEAITLDVMMPSSDGWTVILIQIRSRDYKDSDVDNFGRKRQEVWQSAEHH